MLSSTYPFTHRRVCFWSHEQFQVGQPFRFDGDLPEDSPYQRRNLTQFTPSSNTALFEYLFKGTVGVDYSEDTRPITPLDSNRLRIVYDRTSQVNPMVSSTVDAAFGGKIVSRRFWHPLRQTVYYDEDEDGAALTPTVPGYVSRSPKCPGNYYILDIFSTGQDLEDQSGTVGTFKPETTTYWHEA